MHALRRFYSNSTAIREIYKQSSFSSINSQRFKGYRCKSGIALFAWRVTLNYAYSPFKRRFTSDAKLSMLLRVPLF